MKKIGVFLLFVAVLSFGSGLFLFMNNPKRVMLKMVSNQIEFYSKKASTSKKQRYEIKSNTKIDFNKTNLYNLDSEIYIDSINEKFYEKFNGKYVTSEGKEESGESLPQIYIDKNRLYIRIDGELYYLEFEQDNRDIITTHSKNSLEFDVLLDTIKNYLVNKLPDRNYSKISTKASVASNVFDVEKYSVFFTSNDLNNMFSYVINEIYSGNKMPNLKNVMTKNIEKDTLIKQFNEKVLKPYDKKAKIFEYSIFVKNKFIIKNELTILKKNGSNIKVDIGSYEKKSGVFDYDFEIINNSNKIIQGTIESDDMSSKIKAKYGKYEISGDIVNSTLNKSLHIDVYDDAHKANELATLSMEYKEITKDLEYKFEVNASSKSETQSFSLVNSSSKKKDVDVPSFDVTKATKMNLNKLFE